MPTLYQYIFVGALLVALMVMLKEAKKCWKELKPKEDK